MTSPGHIVFLHDTMRIPPAEIARRTGLSPTRVSDILTRFYDKKAPIASSKTQHKKY